MTSSADISRYDREERAARTTARLLAAGLFVVVLGAVVAFSVYTLRRDARSELPRSGALSSSATPSGMGPVAGADLGRYLETAGEAVAAATGDRVAVVSLAAYRTEAEARRVVSDLAVVSFLVALPGRPAAVTADLGRWVDDQKAAARAERDEIEGLIPTVDDPAFKTFYADEVARLTKAIDSITPEVVFAVAVRGPVARLQALRSEPAVRVIEVAPTDVGTEPELRGVRPEETTVAGEPAFRPL